MILSVKEPKEDIFSRLSWQTNFQKNPYLPIITRKNEYSKKSFIGHININKGEFMLKRNRPFLLKEFLPTVIIKGKFKGNKIIIKTRLGIISTIVILFFLSILIISAFSSLMNIEKIDGNFFSLLFTSLFITLIPIVMILAERKVLIDKAKEIIET
jgi:hypothetical protein